MRIKYKNCLELVEELLGTKPTHSELSKITGISANALSNRLSNDGYLKDNEIEKIEKHYKIKLNNSQKTIELKYFTTYSDLAKNITQKTIHVPIDCFENFSINEEYFVINALGESMKPFIEDGDRLIVEKYKNKQIMDNRIYIFNYSEKIFIKRLVENVKQIIAISDDKNFNNIILENDDLKNFSIIGQIVGLVREVD